ncbi:MAG: hypothetical protein IJ375_02855 [Oscillospiraceae bacterium]|nr:hypothetical protein [Oscillospiraceae bacterium]
MDELIYCQRKIPKERWRYGFRSSAATGCGWIATYNALRLLGQAAEPEALIRYYERQVPLIQGNLGTMALSPAFYFRKRGYAVEHTSVYERFDAVAKASDVCILFYHWWRKWKLGAHFVAVEYRDGEFIGYNTYRNSTGPDRYGPSLEGFVRGRKYFGAVLIGIRK